MITMELVILKNILKGSRLITNIIFFRSTDRISTTKYKVNMIYLYEQN